MKRENSICNWWLEESSHLAASTTNGTENILFNKRVDISCALKLSFISTSVCTRAHTHIHTHTHTNRQTFVQTGLVIGTVGTCPMFYGRQLVK